MFISTIGGGEIDIRFKRKEEEKEDNEESNNHTKEGEEDTELERSLKLNTTDKMIEIEKGNKDEEKRKRK